MTITQADRTKYQDEKDITLTALPTAIRYALHCTNTSFTLKDDPSWLNRIMIASCTTSCHHR